MVTAQEEILATHMRGPERLPDSQTGACPRLSAAAARGVKQPSAGVCLSVPQPLNPVGTCFMKFPFSLQDVVYVLLYPPSSDGLQLYLSLYSLFVENLTMSQKLDTEAFLDVS